MNSITLIYEENISFHVDEVLTKNSKKVKLTFINHQIQPNSIKTAPVTLRTKIPAPPKRL